MLHDLENAINVKDAKESKETHYTTSPKNKMSDQNYILVELPYWKCIKLRHNLDVMHIEKKCL